MIGGAKVELSPMEAKELPPKNPSQDRISVTKNGGRNAMETEDYLKESLCHLCCCIWVLEGVKCPYFER